MKRILEASPVKGYQLFRYLKEKPDGSRVVLPNYYVRHGGTETSTGTDRLQDAKIAVKKLAGEEARQRRRRTAKPEEVTVGTLLDLVIKDYAANGLKTLKHARAQVERGLRPFFGDMRAEEVDTDKIDRWMSWRASHRLRISLRRGSKKLEPSSIKRELSLLRRAYQLGYERKPQLVGKIPPIKKLAENNVRKGFVTQEQYHRLMQELPKHLRAITCVAYHVANRKGELLNLEWSDVDLDGNPPVITLWPGETKNSEGRTLPIVEGQMLDTLRDLKAERDRNASNETRVFLNVDEKPLQYHHLRKDWDDACVRAGIPGLLFHDLRRSAVRNLRRAGASQTVARQFSGHKTNSVFDRYNISDFYDLKDAAAKLRRFLRKEQAFREEGNT
ncbi:MAG TPA: site-specific integrase [Terriglobia bacterium]|nr:site-specific integrase [Terriglobia bacterium]